MEIKSCPKALLLHFKRSIVTQEAKSSPNVGDNANGKESKEVAPPMMEMVLRKNKAKIPLEKSFSIDAFVGNDEGGPPGDYHLRGVVHHIGGTASSGHYTTCAKRTLPSDRTGVDGGKERSSAYTLKDNEEQWVFFDDRVGAKKDLEHVAGMEKNQRNCYMALYELR